MTTPRRRRRHGFGSIEKNHRRYGTRYTNLRRERKYGPTFDTYAEAEQWLNEKSRELNAVWVADCPTSEDDDE